MPGILTAFVRYGLAVNALGSHPSSTCLNAALSEARSRDQAAPDATSTVAGLTVSDDDAQDLPADNSTGAAGLASSIYEFNNANMDQQAQDWQAAQNMTMALLVLLLSAMLLHAVVLLPACLLARRGGKQLSQLLVFPVFEHTLAGLVMLPLGLAPLVVLLLGGPAGQFKLAAAVALVLVLGYQGMVYSALLPVASRRRQGLGLEYVVGEPASK